MTEIEAHAPAPAETPFMRLDRRVIGLWRVHGIIRALFLTPLAIGGTLALEVDIRWALPLIALLLLEIWLIPPWRYRHYAYRIGELDVRVRQGWLWRSESVVLHSRIQHVDTHQGPIERSLGLGTVKMYTAGTVGAMLAIPGLAADWAERLRDRLIALSGADDAV